jgi:magnesium transporter
MHRTPRVVRPPRRRRHSPGTSPGTVIVDPEARPTRLHLFCYGPDRAEEFDVQSLAELRQAVGRDPVVWVQADGLGDAQALGWIAEVFQIHPLALEDVVNVGQRPRADEYGTQIVIFLRMPRAGSTSATEQLAVVLGNGFVITFLEDPGDVLDPVRLRIRRSGGRIRNEGSDYLAYAILDSVIDAYFPVLEAHGDRLAELEHRLFVTTTPVSPIELYDLSRELLSLRGWIRPLRELLSVLLRAESSLVHEKTQLYLRDCYDHALELIELIEINREIDASLIDLYRANINLRLNEIMKVLTIIATIFMPLTFIAGVYGMNFKHMPELSWRFGYPLSLLVMAGVAVGMLFYFRKKGWMG